MEAFNLSLLGHNSNEYVHALVEALKLAYADRDAYYGDPQFSRIPTTLISKEYAGIRPSLIDTSRASDEHIPGDPEHMQARARQKFVHARLSNRSAAHQDTTCVSVIDKAGNMFSATLSGTWVPAVVAGDTGIPLESASAKLRAHARASQPNRSGKASEGYAHSYDRIAQWQTLAGILDSRRRQPRPIVDFNMNPQQAVEAPRFNSLADLPLVSVHGMIRQVAVVPFFCTNRN